MKSLMTWRIAISAVLVLFAATALLAAGGHMVVGGNDQKVDLNDLYDGETRVFGEGEHQLTATRKGDVVILNNAGESDNQELVLECQLDTDKCTIITGADDNRTMVMIRKTAECEDGQDCMKMEHNIRVHEMHGGAHGVWISDDGDQEVLSIGDGPNVFAFRGSSKTMLRCPEGDTTMSVDKAEAEDTFLCPRHSVPLEKLSGPEGLHEILLKVVTEAD
jgi:hypothetical protein